MHGLIFVCEANICRSPLMAHALMSVADADGWHITSAGTRVVQSGSRMCAVSAEVAADLRGRDAAELASEHGSASIAPDALRAADMILTASRAERAAVAAAVPERRTRVFTLREAVHLGDRPVQPDELEETLVAGGLPHGLALYAEALHGRRGFVAPPAAGRSLLGRRRPDPYDIADAHHDSARAHRATLMRTVDEVARFHRQATAFLAATALPNPR